MAISLIDSEMVFAVLCSRQLARFNQSGEIMFLVAYADMVCTRSRTSLPYSLLDSFPHIYDLTSDKASARTALSTDTGISTRIKALRAMVQRGVKVDEREALSNGLAEIAEAYVEGWDSGSDEDDD